MEKTIICISTAGFILASGAAMAAPSLSSVSCGSDTITVTVGDVTAATSMSVVVTTATQTNTFEIQTLSPNESNELVMGFENDTQLLGTVGSGTSFSVTVGSNPALSGSCTG